MFYRLKILTITGLTDFKAISKIGSCLLRVMSTEISVDIAVDTQSIVARHSVDSRSTLGRHLVDIQSTQGRYSIDTRSIQRSIVSRHSVETQSIVVPDVSRPIQLFVHQHLLLYMLYRPTVNKIRKIFRLSWSKIKQPYEVLTAMQGLQPASTVLANESTSCPLIPKSQSLKLPFSSTKILDGLTSVKMTTSTTM